MAEISEEFSEFIDASNFSLAWERIQRSIRYEVKDRVGLAVYGPQHTKHLEILRNQILSNKYIPSSAHDFHLPKRDGSKRRFAFLDMDDRLIYQALGNTIIRRSYDDVMQLAAAKRIFASIPTSPRPDGTWDYFVFKPVFSRGDYWSSNFVYGQYDLFINEILKTSDEIKGNFSSPWMIKTDISAFYHSIPHENLIEILKSKGWLTDESLMALLRNCLSTWRENNHDARGIPVGYETSEYLANLYLTTLDTSESIEYIKMIRYVDDIYIFANNRTQAERVIKQVDSYLRERLDLKLNKEKTEKIKLRDYSRQEIKTKIRNNLSRLKDAHLRLRKQKELLEKFNEFYHSNSDDDSENACVAEKIVDPSAIAFILYRLREPYDQAKNVALCFLSSFPDYSKHALIYLSKNYSLDDDVVDEIWQFVKDAKQHSELRLNCLDALSKMRGFVHIERYLLETEFDDWYLQSEVLDLFPTISVGGDSYFGFFASVAKKVTHPIVKAKAIKLAFDHCETKNERTHLINFSLALDSEFFRKLAIYLWQQNIDIHQDDVHISRLRDTTTERLLDIETIESMREFNSNFRKLFGFHLDNKFPIETVFQRPTEINQLLLTAFNTQETNVFVKSVYRLTLELLTSVVRLNNNERVISQDLEKLVEDHFDADYQTFENISSLQRNYKKAQTSFAHPQSREEIRNQIGRLFRYHIGKLHTLLLGQTMRDKIFICYCREDEEWRSKAYQTLKARFGNKYLPVWSDREILPSQDWDEEIQKALEQTKVALILVSFRLLASDYICTTELPYFLEKWEENEVHIYWIPVDHSSVFETPLGKIQSAHSEAEIPLCDYPTNKQNAILVNISDSIFSEFYKT